MLITAKEQNLASSELKIRQAQDTTEDYITYENQEKETFSREKKKFTQSEPKMNYILKLSDKDFKVIITLLNKVKQNPKQKKKKEKTN